MRIIKNLLLAFLLITPFVLRAQTTDEETYPTGKINRSIFFNKTNKEVYEPEYEKYVPNADAVKYIKGKKGKFQIKMVMGFWCDDSKLYVPRLLKTLEEAKWDTEDNEQLKIFGVDTNKQAGFEGFKNLNIVKVPTIIVYYNDREIGRIEESPKVSVEEDLVKIMKSIE
jgi:thiol-disulfide isomerase/thioredoxin